MKILIVDDDLNKQNHIKNTLNSLGYNDIETCRSRNQLMFLLQELDIDVVILDNNFVLYEEGYDVKQNLGLSLLNLIKNCDSYKQRVKNAKFILCSSDELNPEEVPESYLGNIIFDMSVDLNKPFKELLEMVK